MTMVFRPSEISGLVSVGGSGLPSRIAVINAAVPAAALADSGEACMLIMHFLQTFLGSAMRIHACAHGFDIGKARL